jgi:hypothetical protein
VFWGAQPCYVAMVLETTYRFFFNLKFVIWIKVGIFTLSSLLQ